MEGRCIARLFEAYVAQRCNQLLLPTALLHQLLTFLTKMNARLFSAVATLG